MDLTKLLTGIVADEDRSMNALPKGSYPVIIESVESKTWDDGNKSINIKLRVFGEKYSNYCLFDNLAITGQYTEHTLKRLKKLSIIFGSSSTDSWPQKSVNVSVGIKNSDPTKNIIWGYSAMNSSQPAQIQQPQVQTQAPPNGMNVTTDDLPF